MTAVRGVPAAERATVCVASEQELRGRGLLLQLEGTTYVLTCHHIVAPIDASKLKIVARGAAGEAIAASVHVVDRLSHPSRDAIVLGVDEDVGRRDQPWLHSPGADYAGGLPATVVLSPEIGGIPSFAATLGPGADNFTVPGSASVSRYVLPRAYPLGKAEDAREGISGGVVVCEDGVVGLVHFARSESSLVARAAVANPLSAWANGWPALANRIQPFVDKALASFARVVRADADELGEFLTIHCFRPDLYVERGLEANANSALTKSGSLLLLGKPRSGKTRIVRELLRSHPGAVVVIPKVKSPPDRFESSSLAENEVIVVVDNLEEDGDILDPIEWWQRIRAINETGTVLVATCRVGDDWDRIRRVQETLVRRLEQSMVYTSSPPEGNDLTREQGWVLAQKLRLSEAQFDERFDGTPGSLFDDGPDAGAARELPPGQGTGIALRPLDEHQAPSNVPAFTSQFVGREVEIAALKQLLGDERLVTITAAGGSGKTRLAFHVAAQLRDDYLDGVWLAELSVYRSPVLVPSVVARAVGLTDAPDRSPVERLVAHLVAKRVLLVLNGCDHVHDAVARLVETLIDQCPDLACLATSRSPLGARGETVYRLDSLDAESTGTAEEEADVSEAVELFLDRARETGSEVPFSQRDKVVEIARLVAGNPLNIELVAGQLGGWALGQVATRLAERLSQGGETREEGDPTLAATVDVVVEALDRSERLLFGTVCVFVGGFRLEAVQALGTRVGLVEAEVPVLLRCLIDRQLILIDKRGRDADRFRILESLRQEGRRRLREAGRLEEMERFHAEYFLGLAERASGAKGEPGEAEWLDRLEGELENVRAALLWALHGEPEIGLKLGANLWWFWYQRSHLAEGRRWLRRLRAALEALGPTKSEPEERRRLRAELLNGAGTFAYLQGDFDEAETLHQEALAIREALSTDRWVAGSLNNLGLIARRRGRKDRAARHFREALEISRAHGNAFWETIHLNNLGILLREWNDPTSARDCQEKSLTIAARLGGAWGTAQALAALAAIEADEGALEEARDLLQRSLAIRVDIQNPQGIANSLADLARVERLAGNGDQSAGLYREALDMIERLGDRAALAELLEGLGMTLVERDAASAARAFGAAKQIRVTIGFPKSPLAESEVSPFVHLSRDRLGEERFSQEHRAGLEALLTATVAELQVAGGPGSDNSGRDAERAASSVGPSSQGGQHVDHDQ